MYYLYIIQSQSTAGFYVGYTSDIDRRLIEHNNTGIDSYTSKFRPWTLRALFAVSENEKEAIQVERFIKKQKSRNLLLKLIDPSTILEGRLAQLVRVPHLRINQRVPARAGFKSSRRSRIGKGFHENGTLFYLQTNLQTFLHPDEKSGVTGADEKKFVSMLSGLELSAFKSGKRSI